MPKLLNLGCGSRFCSQPGWANVDFVSADSRVRPYNLLRGVPFPDNTFDAVYHSNVLEHFHFAQGERFIEECWRVLLPGGILRVVVPDLEGICRFYLSALDKIKSGDESWRWRYGWIMLEMYDQAVRTRSGGEMLKYLQHASPEDRDFVVSRIGSVGREDAHHPGDHSLGDHQSSAGAAPDGAGRQPAWRRWARRLKRSPFELRPRLRALARSKILTLHERRALDVGLFRLGGEIHQWMYDEASLGALLHGKGFVDVRRCSATDSQIENWPSYFLDADPDGFEHAPSALFMEGTKLQSSKPR